MIAQSGELRLTRVPEFKVPGRSLAQAKQAFQLGVGAICILCFLILWPFWATLLFPVFWENDSEIGRKIESSVEILV